MGKGSSSPPPAPDPAATIAAQSAANKEAVRESAKVNAIDITGPAGSTTYRRDANGMPIEQITTLNPGSQYVYDKQQSISGKMADTADNRLDGLTQTGYTTSGLPYDPSGYDTSAMPSWQRDTSMPYDPRSYGSMDVFTSSVGNSIYDQGMSRLQPQLDEQNRAFDQKMADRGIPVGSEAYMRARESLDRGQNDARTSLINQSTIGSLAASKDILGMEQGLRSTAWNEDLQGSQQEQADWLKKLGTEQDLRSRVDADNLKERNQTINEVAMLMGGSPQMQMPNAPSMAQYNVQAPDVGGITNSAYNAQMAQYNAQQANSPWNGIMGVASAAMPYAMSLSWSAMKHDIQDA